MRLFFALLPPPEVRAALDAYCRTVAQLCRGHFTDEGNFHVTVVFLGEQAPEKTAVLRGAALAAAGGTAPFEVGLARLGSFGLSGKVLWAGLGNGRAETSALYARLDAALREEGFEAEARRYTPHLTLARQARFSAADGLAVLEKQAPLPPLHFPVRALSLMESTRVDGALRYLERFRAPLTGTAV